MSSYLIKLENFLNNGKNLNKIYFFLVVFLCIVKLPSLLTSDIQPWDEGMYATRVLSIHTNGDFIDQSSHSVGKFYSASHPPLLIWISYFVTLIFGVSSVVLKLIVFVFSLLCILLILLIGKDLFSLSTGFYAAIIFCGNIIFTVFSQRFQFDIPYTFFILLSFYLIFRYNDTLKFKYLIYSGIAFGCCLMTKILVGLYIPMILCLSYLIIKDKFNISLKDIISLTVIGILIALPWHLYMFAKSGPEFTDYFFKFHIIDRAIEGVEMNEKNSGYLYHINYLFSIIPFSVLIFPALIKDLINFNKINWQKIFVNVWFVTGLLILTFFKTKLEVYSLMILVPGAFIIPLFLKEINNENIMVKVFLIFITILNILWFATESFRPEIKLFLKNGSTVLNLVYFLSAVIILFLISRQSAKIIELKKTYYIFILIFFFGISIYYLFFTPVWVNGFKLSEIKKYIDKSGKKEIVYVSSNYRFNPQFSYYFDGLNLSWNNPEFKFDLINTGNNFDSAKNKLNAIGDKDYFIIIEKDGINRASDFNSDLLLPDFFKMSLKSTGYELYEKRQ
ncbi:MAG TPA: glycosyltransferase family 39 protein [Ignavibacteria bacterium]|nr:glycosyltransferase family 39 protein [Ignavibacteria bacterium]